MLIDKVVISICRLRKSQFFVNSLKIIMASTLPRIALSGTLLKILNQICDASVPELLNGDFLGSGFQKCLLLDIVKAL